MVVHLAFIELNKQIFRQLVYKSYEEVIGGGKLLFVAPFCSGCECFGKINKGYAFLKISYKNRKSFAKLLVC